MGTPTDRLARGFLEPASQLIAAIKSLWSDDAEYLVQDSEGKQVLRSTVLLTENF
jgi:hypothetical protein